MARKKKQKAKVEVAPEKKIEVKIAPHVTENTPSYYCNYVSVIHSRYDFTLMLAKLPTMLKPEQLALGGKDVLPVEAALEVVISPKLISPLIEALRTQKDRYEAQFGKIEKGEQS